MCTSKTYCSLKPPATLCHIPRLLPLCNCGDGPSTLSSEYYCFLGIKLGVLQGVFLTETVLCTDI